MSKLDIAKKIVKAYHPLAQCGIYNTQNVLGDPMQTIYKDDRICIKICTKYEYFEVFGLSEKDFAKLEEFYKGIEVQE